MRPIVFLFFSLVANATLAQHTDIVPLKANYDADSIIANAYLKKDTLAIKAAVNLLFEGMLTHDSTLLRKAFAPSAVFQSVVDKKKGSVRIATQNVNDFVRLICVTNTTTTLDGRITFERILIDGNLASVWTPYEFYMNGKYTHCGVNSFQLVRLDGTWCIQYLIDTRRK